MTRGYLVKVRGFWSFGMEPIQSELKIIDASHLDVLNLLLKGTSTPLILLGTLWLDFNQKVKAIAYLNDLSCPSTHRETKQNSQNF